jgi:hypothetical protein
LEKVAVAALTLMPLELLALMALVLVLLVLMEPQAHLEAGLVVMVEMPLLMGLVLTGVVAVMAVFMAAVVVVEAVLELGVDWFLVLAETAVAALLLFHHGNFARKY